MDKSDKYFITMDADRIEQSKEDMRKRQEVDQESRGVYLTDQEKAKIYAIEDRYYPIINDAIEAERGASATRPNVGDFFRGISPKLNPEEWKAAQERAAAAIREWEANAPQEWKDAQARLNGLFDQLSKETDALYKAAYKRQYAELGTDHAEITRAAKAQVDRLITVRYEIYKESAKSALSMTGIDLVSLGGKEWKLDATETRKRISQALKPFHFKALGDNTAAIEEIKAYIEQAISSSPYIVKEGTPGANVTIVLKEWPAADKQVEAITAVSLPELTPGFVYGPQAVMPISKLIQKQLMIARYNGQIVEVDVGGEGKERAIVKTSITTDRDLPPEAVEIQNVIGELIQNNGNRPINVTSAQIWRAFAGLDDGATVSEENQNFIAGIIDQLRGANGQIDFTEQVEKHKRLKKNKEYDYAEGMLKGPLVLADETAIRAGGHETKGFMFYRLPLFYMHSHLTNQIRRIDRELLDTTTEKITDGQGRKHKVETRNNDKRFILLKRHLVRQVARMIDDKKSGSYEGRRSFDGICKAIGLDNPTPKQLRTIRADIELVCVRWKIQGYIKGYELYTKQGSRAYAGVNFQV